MSKKFTRKELDKMLDDSLDRLSQRMQPQTGGGLRDKLENLIAMARQKRMQNGMEKPSGD